MLHTRTRQNKHRLLVHPKSLNVYQLLLLPVAVALPLALSSMAHASDQTVPPTTIQLSSQNAYRFQGWGTSLAWWANVVGGWRSADLVNDDLFGTSNSDHPDRLGLNVIRYNVGASPVVWCQPGSSGSLVNCGDSPTRQRSLPVANQSPVPTCPSFGDGKAVPALVSGPGLSPNLKNDLNQLTSPLCELKR